VRHILEYGDVIWHIPDTKSKVLDILDRVHHNAARIVTGATAKCRTDLLKEAGWETLEHRRTQHRATLMYNILNGRAPPYLLDLVPDPIEARTRYNLRNRGDLQVHFSRLTTYSNSFFPATTRLWNQLPHSVKSSMSHLSFKYNYLKLFPRPQRQDLYYFGRRKEAIAHARLRIGCSFLKAHLCHYLHVIDDPACSCPTRVEESSEHYLLYCPIYHNQRQVMYNQLLGLNIVIIDENLLLYGNPNLDLLTNKKIFKIVHQYITDTARLIR
jgi:hypothetical protein